MVYIAQDSQDAYVVVTKHEITQRIKDAALEAYRAYRNYAMQLKSEEFGGSTEALIIYTKTKYAEHGVQLTTEEAMDEIAADFTEKLLVNEAAIKQLVADDRNLAQKIFDAIKSFVKKVKSALKGEGDTVVTELDKAARLWENALREASRVKGNAAQTDGVTKYSLKGSEFQEDKYFGRQMDKWAELKEGTRVKVGAVKEGSALNQVGLPIAGLYFDVGKIKKAMAAHSDHLSENVLRGIPDLINSPIAITEYTANTVNVYGELFA